MPITLRSFLTFPFNGGRGIKKGQVDWTDPVDDAAFQTEVRRVQDSASLTISTTAPGNTPGTPDAGDTGEVSDAGHDHGITPGMGGGGDDAFDWATEGNTDIVPNAKIAPDGTAGQWLRLDPDDVNVREWASIPGLQIPHSYGNYIPTPQTASALPNGSFFWTIPDNSWEDIQVYLRAFDGNYVLAFQFPRNNIVLKDSSGNLRAATADDYLQRPAFDGTELLRCDIEHTTTPTTTWSSASQLAGYRGIFQHTDNISNPQVGDVAYREPDAQWVYYEPLILGTGGWTNGPAPHNYIGRFISEALADAKSHRVGALAIYPVSGTLTLRRITAYSGAVSTYHWVTLPSDGGTTGEAIQDAAGRMWRDQEEVTYLDGSDLLEADFGGRVMFGNPTTTPGNALEIRTENLYRPKAGDELIFIMPAIPAGPPAGNLTLRARYGPTDSKSNDSALALGDVDGTQLAWADVTAGRVYQALRTGSNYRLIEPTDHQIQELVGAMFSEQSEVAYDDATRKITITFPGGGSTTFNDIANNPFFVGTGNTDTDRFTVHTIGGQPHLFLTQRVLGHNATITFNTGEPTPQQVGFGQGYTWQTARVVNTRGDMANSPGNSVAYVLDENNLVFVDDSGNDPVLRIFHEPHLIRHNYANQELAEAAVVEASGNVTIDALMLVVVFYDGTHYVIKVVTAYTPSTDTHYEEQDYLQKVQEAIFAVSTHVDANASDIDTLQTTVAVEQTEIDNLQDQVGDFTLWSGSQAAYDLIMTKDSDTLYFVTA